MVAHNQPFSFLGVIEDTIHAPTTPEDGSASSGALIQGFTLSLLELSMESIGGKEQKLVGGSRWFDDSLNEI